jgi:hypothetical protein
LIIVLVKGVDGYPSRLGGFGVLCRSLEGIGDIFRDHGLGFGGSEILRTTWRRVNEGGRREEGGTREGRGKREVWRG